MIESLLGESLPHGVTLAISFALAYLLTTSLHITIGEQVPKIWAIQKAEYAARLVARPLHLFTRVFHPFIALLNAVSNAILRVMGVRTAGNLEEGETPEELKRADRSSRSPAASSIRARPACSPASSTCTSRRRAR